MVDGLDEVTTRLEQTLNDAALGKTEATLTQALIQAGAYAADITPIDTGTMIGSQGRQVSQTMSGWRGTLYYGAEYAKWVHEMPGTLKGQPRADFGKTRSGIDFGGGTGVGNYWDPNGEPQFLKKGMERMAREDLENIIRGNYSV